MPSELFARVDKVKLLVRPNQHCILNNPFKVIVHALFPGSVFNSFNVQSISFAETIHQFGFFFTRPLNEDAFLIPFLQADDHKDSRPHDIK